MGDWAIECTAAWEDPDHGWVVDPSVCGCEQCRARVNPLERAGLCPPHFGKPSSPSVQGWTDGWWGDVEARVEHGSRIPSRRRRRMERAKRRSSRLDGRWHRRVKAQQEREVHFERRCATAEAGRPTLEELIAEQMHDPDEAEREELRLELAELREWAGKAKREGDWWRLDFLTDQIRVVTSLLG